MIQVGNERGTIFSINVENREYWITAKHILTGTHSPHLGSYKKQSATVNILNPGHEEQQWIPETFDVIDPGADIDILVLVPAKPILNKSDSLGAEDGSVGLGTECEFLGFPYGGGWKAHFDNGQTVWFPYMKRCSVSAILQDKTTIWVLDGINNVGFSGGPVLVGTGPEQKVFAVVSGYHTEPAEVVPEAVPIPAATGTTTPKSSTAKPKGRRKEVVNVNSGFILAFSIGSAIDAIRKNQVGPLLTPAR